jgi:PKD repeat protein
MLSDNTATEIPATWVGDSVHVNTVLDAGFSASPLEGVAGVTEFTFTDATTGGTPSYNYEWDFDNNGTVDITAANPTYTYASAGTYTVSLTVTDSLSTSNAEAKTGYIAIYDPGDANKDGNVSSLDITKLERVIMGLDDPTPGADANADGSIDALDITKIELIIIGA